MALGTLLVDVIEDGDENQHTVSELQSVYEVIARANNTTSDDVAELTATGTYTGEHYLVLVSDDDYTTYYCAGGITDTLTDIGTDSNGDRTLTGNSTTYSVTTKFVNRVVNSIATLRLTEPTSAHQTIYVTGYYSTNPGVGGGFFYYDSSDTTTTDDGGLTIVTTSDSSRWKRAMIGNTLYASEFGAVGDYDSSTETGTDNKTYIENMIATAGSTYKWCIDLLNVAVSYIEIDSIDSFNGEVRGSVVNISAKPATDAGDEKDDHGGEYPTFKITNSDGWKLTGGFVNNRYREAFYIETCDKWKLECDIIGDGINNNLKPCYIRYCEHFKMTNFYHSGMSEKPDTSYYAYCSDLWFWNCNSFEVTNFTINGGGGNGIYIGSSCYDYKIDDFDVTDCATSGVQLAYSSFGTFPYRGGISNGLISGCRADGIDVNNTSGSQVVAKLTIENVHSVNNGYNDDGTVTDDGSGLCTLSHVTHVDVIGCHTEDCARTGLYINDCSNINCYGGSILKDNTSNNSGQGLYIGASTDINIKGLDVIMVSSMYAIKLYGALENVSIGGTYSGLYDFPTEDTTTTYDNVELNDAVLTAYAEVQANIPLVNSKVYAASSNALRAFKNVTNTDTTSESGYALIFGADHVHVTGGAHTGSTGGTYCSGFNYCSLTKATCNGGTSAGSQWLSATYCQITNNYFDSTSGNSLLTDSSCTNLITFCNEYVTTGSLSGSFDIQY